jgi:hypothetical protein
MTMRLTAALLACMLAVGRAQTPARDPNAAPPIPTGTASLSGIVKDADGNPLRRASVSIAGDMRLNRTTITDDTGKFVFSALPAGRFTITATKAGYPPMSYGASRPYRTGSGVLLTDGQVVGNIALTVGRGAVLSGTVFDEHGQSMPQVPVMAWEVRTALSGERTLAFPQTGAEAVTTDDRGAYRIYGLPPGEYTVGTAWFFSGNDADVRVPTDAEIRAAFLAVTQGLSALRPGAASGAGPAAQPPRYNYAPVFYPDTVDPMVAVTLPLVAGDERAGVDLHMQFRPVSRIDGVVVGPDGAGASARIAIGRRSRVSALNSSSIFGSGSDGHFASGSVAPGDYTVSAEVPGEAGKPPLWAMADVTVSGAEPISLTLTLQPAMAISGRLVFDGTSIPPPPDLARVIVLLRAMPGTFSPHSVSSTDKSGAFTIVGTTPGRYRVLATAPSTAPAGQPAWSVRSVVSGGQDVTDLPIDIAPGAGVSMTVTFTDRVSELSGTVSMPSGQPATDYFVIALPADQQYWAPQTRRIVSARPDANGRYIIRGLPAGDYRLAATTDLVPGDLSDVNALTLLAAQSAPVRLGLGEKKTVDLQVGR